MFSSNAATRVLAGLVVGLCLSGCASTTPPAASPPAPVSAGPTEVPAEPGPMVQTEPVLPPVVTSPNTPPPVAGGMPVRVALLLPTRSPVLGRAAEAVRAGFKAALDRDPAGVSLLLVDSGDAPQDVAAAYSTASAGADIIVGPLTRSGVSALLQAGAISRPTISLAQPDAPGDAAPPLPSNMLVAALSIEDEARQMADRVVAAHPTAPVFVISTDILWQRRAAKAFSTQAALSGLRTETMELGIQSGFLDANGMAQLRRRIQTENPAVIFLAMDIGQARQLRIAVGGAVPFVGTSQLNPYSLADWPGAEPMDDMNGTELVDIPWLLQADHPAVMVYPHMVAAPDQRIGADLERLYALGIDAYRIVREVAAQHATFDIDGVTGRLRGQFGGPVASFRRTEQPAVYRDGRVAPLTPVLH